MNQQSYEDGDFQGFMVAAKETARLNGACVLEFFTCPNSECGFQQCACHAFKEVCKCAKCGQRMASVVPRLEQPGEITKLQLQEAIRVVRASLPPVPDKTMEWCEQHEGAVRAVATTWGCGMARKALDQVEALARSMSGGHTAGGVLNS